MRWDRPEEMCEFNPQISVMAKAVAGDVEMVAGLVWRYKYADNYYVARWNADSVRVDRVVKGERQLMTPREIKITLPAKASHTLTVEHRGEDIKVFVGKDKIFEGKDKASSTRVERGYGSRRIPSRILTI